MPRLPLGERALIAFECCVVEIENTGIAATVTAVVEIGLRGRQRLRVVAG
jgi:hypothetical protein